MIEYIRGEVAELTPTLAVIDCQGVGYGLNISLTTYSTLAIGREARLYVYEAIREDAHLLYGFIRPAGTGTFPATHLGIGCRPQYGPYDSVVPLPYRTRTGYRCGTGKYAQIGQRNRSQNRRTNNC